MIVPMAERTPEQIQALADAARRHGAGAAPPPVGRDLAEIRTRLRAMFARTRRAPRPPGAPTGAPPAP